MEGYGGFVEHSGECYNDRVTNVLRTANLEDLL
jgi:hypothetical protein